MPTQSPNPDPGNPQFPVHRQTSKPAEVVRYLRDCYRSDNREQAVFDLFARKIQFRRFAPTLTDLLQGVLDEVPFADPDLVELAKTAQLHTTEKALELVVFPIVGRLAPSEDDALDEAPETPASDKSEGSGGGRWSPPKRRASRRFCAPLLSFPLTLGTDGEITRVSVELGSPRPNVPLLNELAKAAACDDPENSVESVLAQLPHPPFDRASVGGLAHALEEVFDLDTEGLLHFPKLLTEAEVETRVRARPKAGAWLACLPAAAITLRRRSVETRGVLTELKQIAEGVETAEAGGPELGLSAPLWQVTTGRSPGPEQVERAKNAKAARRPGPSGAPSPVPAVLSAPQHRVLEAAARQPLSLVIGPPGTGKSFTIATLAVEALYRGESVLVVSQKHHAVDVVADKIDTLVGGRGFAVRGGRRHYRRDLVQRLENLLSGILPFEERSVDTTRQQAKTLQQLDRQLLATEQRLERRTHREIRWGQAWHRYTQAEGFWTRLAPRLQLAFKPPQTPPAWQVMETYQGLLEQRLGQAAEVLRSRYRQNLETALRDDRASLNRLLSSLRSRTAERRRERFAQADTDKLFTAFPVWMTNLAELGSMVPLVPRLFDLVIFDEATQIDLASAAPALQRGRRAVVVGDPKQLRHLSFLARRTQDRLAEQRQLDPDTRQRLDYRAKSLLDAVSEVLTSQDSVTFLDEHFRSLPPIIAFSNAEFYDQRLRVMQQRPIPAVDAEGRSPLRHHPVGGRRDDQGVNQEEAEALVDAVVQRVEAEAQLPPALRHSLGVLSPFRAQVEWLTHRLGERLSSGSIEQHALRVGTPFAFQGEERDLMYLSLAVDAESHPSALRFAERPDVFNVAITRARTLQKVFTSLSPAHCRSPLLRRFLEHLEAAEQRAAEDGSRVRSAASSGQGPSPGQPPSDPFLNQVVEALAARGCQTWTAWPIAGLEVDLVVARDGACVGIDLVGYPGDYGAAFELERYRILHRAGLVLMPLPFSTWCQDPEACVEAVLRSLT